MNFNSDYCVLGRQTIPTDGTVSYPMKHKYNSSLCRGGLCSEQRKEERRQGKENFIRDTSDPVKGHVLTPNGDKIDGNRWGLERREPLIIDQFDIIQELRNI